MLTLEDAEDIVVEQHQLHGGGGGERGCVVVERSRRVAGWLPAGYVGTGWLRAARGAGARGRPARTRPPPLSIAHAAARTK
eukprot:COSAG06_NODE_237_length_19433_cov_92.613961_2_plen_81_part_00